MGKVAPVVTKYVIYAQFEANGIVERPDVIGAIFGQTEGLLGPDLDLRELQRSGRIGRIEVTLEYKGDKTIGRIVVPSSVDMAETALIAAALETIQRIGPASARVKVLKVEDVREEKRKYVVERAKQLLRQLIHSSLPDSHELTERLRQEVRAMELIEYGPEKLPAGPDIFESDEIIVVEGRADVINLLKHGFYNVIGMNGTKVPRTIIELSKKKTVTAFVDGDRGGDLILKELLEKADIDFVARAPEGKEVEELTRKEILKALRSKVPVETLKHERHKSFDPEIYNKLRSLYQRVKGKKKALILDNNFEILGEISVNEVQDVINEVNAKAVVMDGILDEKLAKVLEESDVQYVYCKGRKGDFKTKLEVFEEGRGEQ